MRINLEKKSNYRQSPHYVLSCQLASQPSSSLQCTGQRGGGVEGARWREWDTRRRMRRAEVVEVPERITLALVMGAVDTTTSQQ